MADTSTVTQLASGERRQPGPLARLAKWLASERVFRLIPFVLVEALFIITILIPFALTIWISMLKWRANRPFETAVFTGLENYAGVLENEQFWSSVGRTFYFAGVAVALELLIEGNYEYFNILDKNLADVMNKNISAEEAAKRIEAGWNKVTNDIGLASQQRVWRKGVEQGIYLDKF